MRRWQCSLDQATPLHMVRCIRISVSDRWFVLMPHLQSFLSSKFQGITRHQFLWPAKLYACQIFALIPFGNLCHGVVSLQKIEPFFTPGSCRSWRDQRRWQIKGGKGIGVDSIYTQGPTEKKRYVQSKTKKPTSYRLFVSFHGYKIPFLGERKGSANLRDSALVIGFPGGGSGYEAGC